MPSFPSAQSDCSARSIAASVREAAGPGSEDPGDDAIREYAYHLYQQSNCAPGQDLHNWLEATACLKAAIPGNLSGTGLPGRVDGREGGDPGAGATVLLSVDF